MGLGSGKCGARHHQLLLDLADRLPQVTDGRSFIFSTSAIMGNGKVAEDHGPLRDRLRSMGYTVVDEPACKGYDTNGFLKYVGGMDKWRPNEGNPGDVEDLARNLLYAHDA